jgi:hypothetical protein
MKEWFYWAMDSEQPELCVDFAQEHVGAMSRFRLFEQWWEESGPPPWPLHNVFLGVTAEDQQRADERIPVLLDIPAAKRFVSCEPLLGKILLDNGETSWLSCHADDAYRLQNDGECCESRTVHGSCFKGIDWIVCGGEAGPGARPCHPDWIRSLRDQCVAAGTKFFFKGWGDWAPWHTVGLKDGMERCADDKTKRLNISQSGEVGGNPHIPGDYTMYRVGKKAAGRELDGETWDQYPVVE